MCCCSSCFSKSKSVFLKVLLMVLYFVFLYMVSSFSTSPAAGFTVLVAQLLQLPLASLSPSLLTSHSHLFPLIRSSIYRQLRKNYGSHLKQGADCQSEGNSRYLVYSDVFIIIRVFLGISSSLLGFTLKSVKKKTLSQYITTT